VLVHVLVRELERVLAPSWEPSLEKALGREKALAQGLAPGLELELRSGSKSVHSSEHTLEHWSLERRSLALPQVQEHTEAAETRKIRKGCKQALEPPRRSSGTQTQLRTASQMQTSWKP
jgi:hypothetical protein